MNHMSRFTTLENVLIKFLYVSDFPVFCVTFRVFLRLESRFSYRVLIHCVTVYCRFYI